MTKTEYLTLICNRINRDKAVVVDPPQPQDRPASNRKRWCANCGQKRVFTEIITDWCVSFGTHIQGVREMEWVCGECGSKLAEAGK